MILKHTLLGWILCAKKEFYSVVTALIERNIEIFLYLEFSVIYYKLTNND